MARVEIVRSLVLEIRRRFSIAEAHKVLDLIATLEEHPSKGKPLGTVGGILIKELKYKGFRFYFLTDGFRLKACNQDSLTDLLMRFVRMSDKRRQRETIEEIRTVLRKIGPHGFT